MTETQDACWIIGPPIEGSAEMKVVFTFHSAPFDVAREFAAFMSKQMDTPVGMQRIKGCICDAINDHVIPEEPCYLVVVEKGISRVSEREAIH